MGRVAAGFAGMADPGTLAVVDSSYLLALGVQIDGEEKVMRLRLLVGQLEEEVQIGG